MKKITEMTEQEILALTNEDLELMIKFGMAEAGIKLLDKPTEPTYHEIPTKDEVAYSVYGFNLVFKDKELAEKLSSFLTEVLQQSFAPDYTDSNYDHKYLKSYKPTDYSFSSIGNITKEGFYNKETISEIYALVKENKKLESEYKALLSEYNDTYDKASYIRNDIYEAHANVHAKYQRMENIKRQYLVYLQLAKGDAEIAYSFLEKAYEVDSDTYHYIYPDAPTVVSGNN